MSVEQIRSGLESACHEYVAKIRTEQARDAMRRERAERRADMAVLWARIFGIAFVISCVVLAIL